MALYLVQHGLAKAKDIDPQQGLTDLGISQTKLIAGVAKGYQVQVSTIVHSGKKRAKQTAEIFGQALQPEFGLQEMAGLHPLDDVTLFHAQLDTSHNHMYIGHLPFMAKLTSLLTTGSSQHPVFTFQNSGIVCLKKNGTGGWSINWSLMPTIN